MNWNREKQREERKREGGGRGAERMRELEGRNADAGQVSGYRS